MDKKEEIINTEEQINYVSDDLEEYDNKINNLKDTVKMLKKMKKRQEEIKKLEREKEEILKNMSGGKHGKKKH